MLFLNGKKSEVSCWERSHLRKMRSTLPPTYNAPFSLTPAWESTYMNYGYKGLQEQPFLVKKKDLALCADLCLAFNANYSGGNLIQILTFPFVL